MLTAFSVGRTTGVVLDCGHSFTTATIVHDGYSFNQGCKRNEYAGNMLNNILLSTIQKNFENDVVPEIALKH